jgi:hypothetical protein
VRGVSGRDQDDMHWEQVGLDFSNSVNAICLAPDFPKPPELLVLHGVQLLWSEDNGTTFQQWNRSDLGEDFLISTLAAPNGFAPGTLVLVGSLDGDLRFI